MQSEIQTEQQTPSRIDLLKMLSNACKRKEPEIDLFSGNPTTAAIDELNLLDQLNEMECAGYKIGTPIKSPEQTKRNYCAWLLPITTLDFTCTATFYVPDDVA